MQQHTWIMRALARSAPLDIPFARSFRDGRDVPRGGRRGRGETGERDKQQSTQSGGSSGLGSLRVALPKM